jgi:hypothetical protein
MENLNLITKNKKDSDIKLKVSRTYFIANRVVLSQTLLLIITGLLAFIIVKLNLFEIIFSIWYSFILIIPTLTIAISIILRKRLRFKCHWIISILPIVIIWISYTFYIGVLFDYVCGYGKTLLVSITLALYYIIGYLIARVFVRIRGKYSKKFLRLTFILGALIIIIITWIWGIQFLNSAAYANDLNEFDFFEYNKEYLNCLFCAIGLFIMFSGIALTISALLNYAVILTLYDGEKGNIENKTPNRLIYIYLMGTSIVLFIVWICMELLICPLVGGGGGESGAGGDGAGGDSGDKTKKKMTKISKQLLNTTWQRYKLD